MRAVVLLLVLVVCCALLLLWAASRGRRPSVRGGSGPASDEFPLLRARLPPPGEMLEALRQDRPRIRRRRPEGRPASTRLLREPSDYARCDGVADHYTEDLRVRAGVGPEHFSLWSVWANRTERTIVSEWAEREAGGRPTAADLRAALERYAGPAAVAATWDAHPALALHVLRRAARRQCDGYTAELSVLDAGPGWGAQLAAACAAEAREYHAYLPYQSRASLELARKLGAAAAQHRPGDVPESAYFVRQIEVGQANPPPQYHVAFVQAADLTPLHHVDRAGSEVFRTPAWDSLRSGGQLALFCPPTRDAADRLAAVLERLSARIPAFAGRPRVYEAAVGGRVHTVAYVWTKTAG